ncbi:hypothetical protein [Streptomyces sp. ATexAB-D23]|uniref:hypothetical protein n=1 Tax=Streptomyces sp. ATexAB-D23 TaxID=1157635 RepID=UPI003B63BF3A
MRASSAPTPRRRTRGATSVPRAGGLPLGAPRSKVATAPGRSGDLWLSAKDNGVAVLRSDDAGPTRARVNDDSHQWGWTGEVITGDPRVHGRVHLGTNGRGIQYAQPQ